MVDHRAFVRESEAYVGKTLGNYYLEQLAEQSEIGPVFQARLKHGRADQVYRLRFLALPGNITAEERLLYLGHFQHEASRVAALQHSALLPLNDYGIFDGRPYLISPAGPFTSFQHRVMKHGPLEARQVSYYLDTLAEALEYIHQQGILHLNLNARTVLLRSDGRLLIADTGLVRVFAPQLSGPAAGMARSSLELENGTPLLRDQQGKALYGLDLASAPAPELLLGQPPGRTTDVYAQGALLYYLLTGHRAMRGKTLAEIAQQHLNATVPSLSLWKQGLPSELERLLISSMDRNPARRPGSPAVLANAYANILLPGENRRAIAVRPSALPVLEIASHEPALPPQRAPRPAFPRRRVITLIAFSGSAAALAGLALWMTRQSSASPSSVASSGTTTATTGTSPSASPQPTKRAAKAPGHKGKVVAQTGDIPLNSAKTFPIDNSDNPGVLVHLQNNHFVAFNSTCTHAGCAVNYNRQSHLLECPCHSASFDPARNAAVVAGPASTPLAAIAITVNGDGTITTNA